jgi:hypothetical protein
VIASLTRLTASTMVPGSDTMLFFSPKLSKKWQPLRSRERIPTK